MTDIHIHRGAFHIYRLSAYGDFSYVDSVDSLIGYIEDHYLFDSTEGEQYIVIDAFDGTVIGMYVVETQKVLVAQL